MNTKELGELNNNEKTAVKWFKKHGYNAKIIKQYLSKTIFSVEKEGYATEFCLTRGVDDMNLYMSLFDKSFNMERELLGIGG